MNRPLKKAEKVMIVFVWIVLIVGGWIAFTSTSGPSAPRTVESQKQAGHANYEAYAMAETIVEKYLKAPSTAHFPSMSEASIEVLADDGWKITSYVDSQNSFGAMLRSSWTALFVYKDEDRADIYQVIIDDQEVYRKPGLK